MQSHDLKSNLHCVFVRIFLQVARLLDMTILRIRQQQAWGEIIKFRQPFLRFCLAQLEPLRAEEPFGSIYPGPRVLKETGNNYIRPSI